MQIKIGILSASLIANDFIISLRNLDPSLYKVSALNIFFWIFKIIQLLQIVLFICSKKFVAIAASNLESAKKFALKHNIPKAYGSYEQLFEDEEVQLVYVSYKCDFLFFIGLFHNFTFRFAIVIWCISQLPNWRLRTRNMFLLKNHSR